MKTEQEKIAMCRRYLESKGWKCTAPNQLKPRLLRLAQVMELVPLSAATIWRKAKEGSFPAPHKIGANSTAWKADEIEAWIAGGKPNSDSIEA